jgi:hypothetical protein
MKYWVIKHIPTGSYFPLSSRGGKRGSTYINLPFKGIPRLFSKHGAATITLDWWLKGRAKVDYDNDGDGSSYAVGAIQGNGDPNRISSDMEIIAIELKEY